MKKLNRPDIPDVWILVSLAQNEGLLSFPALRSRLRSIVRTYVRYQNCGGNILHARAPAPLTKLSKRFKKQLIGLYTNQPKVLKPFLKKLRDECSPDVCPMCGSLTTGTLDHFFPKETYPELSLFSENLVPACLCNIKRLNDLTGPNAAERILHPYFDEILERRLLRANFIVTSPDLATPKIELQVHLANDNPDFPSVKFHMNHIVNRTQILAWFDKTWPKYVNSPEIFFEFTPGVVTRPMFRRALIRLIRNQDRKFGTPNNWESMLLVGISENRLAREFIRKRINDLRAIGRVDENLYPD